MCSRESSCASLTVRVPPATRTCVRTRVHVPVRARTPRAGIVGPAPAQRVGCLDMGRERGGVRELKVRLGPVRQVYVGSGPRPEWRTCKWTPVGRRPGCRSKDDCGPRHSPTYRCEVPVRGSVLSFRRNQETDKEERREESGEGQSGYTPIRAGGVDDTRTHRRGRPVPDTGRSRGW